MDRTYNVKKFVDKNEGQDPIYEKNRRRYKKGQL